MVLQSSGQIAASDINVEIGRASNAAFDINGAAERGLAGVASGQIAFSDFYGKASGVLGDPYVTYAVAASGIAALSMPWPVGHATNDVMVFAVQTANQALSTPAGCTLQYAGAGTGTAAAAGSTRLYVFTAVATSGSMGSISIADSGDHTHVYGFVWRNIDYNNPIDAISGGVQVATATTALSYPTLTTNTNNAVIINFAGLGVSTSQSVAPTNADCTDFIVGTKGGSQYATTNGVDGTIAYFYGKKATAGAVSATTATLALAAKQDKVTLALRPIFPAAAPVVSYPGPRQQVSTNAGATSASFYLQNNGVALDDTNSVWLNNAMYASDFEVYVTVSSGSTPTGSAVNTWLNLGTTRSWTISQGATTGIKTSNLLVSIRRISTGVTLVSNTSMYLEAENTGAGGCVVGAVVTF